MAGYVTDVHERHTQLDLDSGWWCSRLQWKPQSNLCENKSDTVFFSWRQMSYFVILVSSI